MLGLDHGRARHTVICCLSTSCLCHPLNGPKEKHCNCNHFSLVQIIRCSSFLLVMLILLLMLSNLMTGLSIHLIRLDKPKNNNAILLSIKLFELRWCRLKTVGWFMRTVVTQCIAHNALWWLSCDHCCCLGKAPQHGFFTLIFENSL